MAAHAWDNPSIADSLKLGLPLQLPPLPFPLFAVGSLLLFVQQYGFRQLFFSPKENVGLVSNSTRPDRKLIAAWTFRTRPLGNSPHHLPVWRVFLASLRTNIFAFPFLRFCDEHFPAVVNRNEPFPLLNILCSPPPPAFKKKLVFVWGKSKKASAGFHSPAARLCYHWSQSPIVARPPPRFSEAQWFMANPPGSLQQ